MRLIFGVVFTTCLFVAGSSQARAASDTSGLSNDEKYLPLTAVLVRKHDLFAVHKLGFYRADRATRRWRKLEVPDSVPRTGRFAVSPEDAAAVVYFVGTYYENKPADGKKGDIYVSHDDGATWNCIPDTVNVSAVCLHRKRLYVGFSPLIDGFHSSKVRTTDDFGKTWDSLPWGDAGRGYPLHRFAISAIIPDPDHPDLVCVSVDTGIRGHFLQADDENYEWKVHSIVWGLQKSQNYFEPNYSSSTTFYTFTASLDNFFDFRFAYGASCCPFRIVPAKERFTYRSGEPVAVPFTVHYDEDMRVKEAWWRLHPDLEYRGKEPPKPDVILLPDDDEGRVWGLKVEFAGEQSLVMSEVNRMWGVNRDRKALGKELRDDPRTRMVRLTHAEPYRRTLDLGKLHDFVRPGLYRVQLLYGSSPYTPNGAIKNGPWGGDFTSDVMEIEILAATEAK